MWSGGFGHRGPLVAPKGEEGHDMVGKEGSAPFLQSLLNP